MERRKKGKKTQGNRKHQMIEIIPNTLVTTISINRLKYPMNISDHQNGLKYSCILFIKDRPKEKLCGKI